MLSASPSQTGMLGGGIREEMETLARIGPELIQPGNNGGELEDHNNELERVDVDITRGR